MIRRLAGACAAARCAPSPARTTLAPIALLRKLRRDSIEPSLIVPCRHSVATRDCARDCGCFPRPLQCDRCGEPPPTLRPQGKNMIRPQTRSPISSRLAVAALLAAAYGVSITSVQAQDLSKFPNWKGEWVRIGAGGQYDPTKPPVRGQQPPITDEYRAIWEKNIAEGIEGGQYFNTQVRCLPGGMPRMMMAYEPMEVILTPDTTYIHITFNNEFRRIYTDGRDFPADEEPSFSGYSIGKWIDEDGDGKYDVLEVETRNLKGPRIFDPSGIPLHEDNQTIVKERISLDKAGPNKLLDQITTFDHAL